MVGYKNLEAWKIGMDVVAAVYRLTRLLPNEERYALGDQLRRAAVSVPANIAEGYARNSPAEFRRFVLIAAGSCTEVQTHLLICERVGLQTREQTRPALLLTDRLGRMLHKLASSLG